MKYQLTQVKGVVVISMSSHNITGSKSTQLLQNIKDQIKLGNSRFVIDFYKVKYINSEGINLLIAALTIIRNAEGELVLTSIVDKVKNLLVITKLNSIFNVKQSLDESIEFLNSMQGVKSN